MGTHQEEKIDKDSRAGFVRHLITVSPNTELETVFKLLEKYHIGCLPVIKGDSLVGILTTKDMTGL